MRRRLPHGARAVWRVGQVPLVAAEDQRQLPRDLESLKQERASTTTRIQGWLSSLGIRLRSRRKLPAPLDALRRWAGSPLPRGRRRRVLRMYAPPQFLREPIAAVAAERRAWLEPSQEASLEQVRQRMHLRGIGRNGSGVLVRGFFGWRDFKHWREVSRFAGFTPTPYHSGASARDHGSNTSGNRHGRWMRTEVAWSGLRYQPESAVRGGCRERLGGGGKRLRRIGSGAVARQLLLALGRFLKSGGFPEGAVLQAA